MTHIINSVCGLEKINALPTKNSYVMLLGIILYYWGKGLTWNILAHELLK